MTQEKWIKLELPDNIILTDDEEDNLQFQLIEKSLGSLEIFYSNNKKKLFIYTPLSEKEITLTFLKEYFLKLKYNLPTTLPYTILDDSYLFKWKENYLPIEIDNFIIKPSWCEIKNTNKIIIELDPKNAFGTGHHESTRTVIKAINTLCLNNKSMLDVGTGSGILSIIGYFKKCKKIIAIDVDKDAIYVAKENFLVNNIKKYYLICGSVNAIKGKYHIVVANIISSILIKIKNELKRKVAKNGFLILGGILKSEKKSFLSNFNMSGFLLKNEIYEGEWVSFILEKLDES